MKEAIKPGKANIIPQGIIAEELQVPIVNRNYVSNLFSKIYQELKIENCSEHMGKYNCSTHIGKYNYTIYRDNNKLNDYVNAIFSFNKKAII